MSDPNQQPNPDEGDTASGGAPEPRDTTQDGDTSVQPPETNPDDTAAQQ